MAHRNQRNEQDIDQLEHELKRMAEDLEDNAKKLVSEAEKNHQLAESEITLKIKLDKTREQLSNSNNTIDRLEKDVSRLQHEMYESALNTSKIHENEKNE